MMNCSFSARCAGLAVVATAALTGTLNADEITLRDGDVLTGRIIVHTDSDIVLDHPTLGRLAIGADRVVGLERTTDHVAALPSRIGLAMMQDDPSDADEDAGDWKSSFTLGVTGKSGNTETLTFNAGIDSKRETANDRTTFDISYYFDSSNGDRTDNKLSSGLRQDWLLVDTPWLYFLQGRYDYDEFESWEHRVGIHTGVGYNVIDEEDFTLDLRAGLGVIKELGSIDEKERFEGLLGLDITWDISDRQSFNFSTTYYPELEDPNEFRWVTRADWALLVDDETNMSLTLGLENEYQTDVDPGLEHNDLRVVAGLRFDF